MIILRNFELGLKMFRYRKAKISSHDAIFVQKSQCMYSVTLRRVGVNIFAGEKK
jgi:hypothetical protein